MQVSCLRKLLNILETRAVLFDFGKFITKSADGQYVTGMIHIFLNLASQSTDMHIDSAVGNKSVVTPDMIQNLISRINAAGVAGQEEQKLKFCGAQCDRLAVHRHCAGHIINGQSFKFEGFPGV